MAGSKVFYSLVKRALNYPVLGHTKRVSTWLVLNDVKPMGLCKTNRLFD